MMGSVLLTYVCIIWIFSSSALEAPLDYLTQQSFHPGEEWLDTGAKPIQAHGGGILYDEKSMLFYWYGENKDGPTLQPDPRYPARVEVIGISCYSSKDLLHWTNEGVVLKADADSPDSDLHSSRVMERPKVLYNKKSGEYVMWIHIDSRDYSAARAGVAWASSPTGPFQFLGSVRPHNHESRDLTVFEDPAHEGLAWMVYSSENNMVLHVGVLSEDYRRLNGTWVRTMINQQREAPSPFYHNGRYFLLTSGCTGWAPNQAEVHVANSMLGPWHSLGDPTRGGTKEAREKTFWSQASFVMPVPGLPGRFIMMGDRWNEQDLRESRYVWLPLWVQDPPNNELMAQMKASDKMLWTSVIVGWFDHWNLDELQKFPLA